MSFDYIIHRLRSVSLGLIDDVIPFNLLDARYIQNQALQDYYNLSESMTEGQKNYINHLNEMINSFFKGYESVTMN